MKPDEFLSWWFAPWTWAAAHAEGLQHAEDTLARRDGYRLWCARNRLPAALPSRADTAWTAVATGDAEALSGTARLFGGLLAARRQDRALLERLPPDDRRWCMSIASIQPLAQSGTAKYAARDTLETRGMVELCRQLERDFPGLWPRLRLLLAPASGDRVAALLKRTAKEPSLPPHAAARMLRCWQLCSKRAGVRLH
jgi:hypothetical protein